MKPETKVFSPSAEIEEDFFDSYRRVQVISQPITLFQMNQFPPQRLESFRHFVRLFPGSKQDILPYITEMKQMQFRIDEHLSRTNKIPAFSSFSCVKRWQKQLAKESAHLCQDTDRLFNTMLDDVESSRLIEYLAKSMSEPPIFQSFDGLTSCALDPPRPHVTWGYYADLLCNSLKAKKMFNAEVESNEERADSRKTSSSPRPRSKDYVQWMLLDRSGK